MNAPSVSEVRQMRADWIAAGRPAVHPYMTYLRDIRYDVTPVPPIDKGGDV